MFSWHFVLLCRPLPSSSNENEQLLKDHLETRPSETLICSLKQQISSLEKWFSPLEERFFALEERVSSLLDDQLETRPLKQQISSSEKQFSAFEERFSALEECLSSLESKRIINEDRIQQLERAKEGDNDPLRQFKKNACEILGTSKLEEKLYMKLTVGYAKTNKKATLLAYIQHLKKKHKVTVSKVANKGQYLPICTSTWIAIKTRSDLYFDPTRTWKNLFSPMDSCMLLSRARAFSDVQWCLRGNNSNFTPRNTWSHVDNRHRVPGSNVTLNFMSISVRICTCECVCVNVLGTCLCHQSQIMYFFT